MRCIAKWILSLGFTLLLTLMTTMPAFAAAWPPPHEAFGDTGLEVLDTGRQAVALMTKIEPHPSTLSMILIPEFYSADGEVLINQMPGGAGIVYAQLFNDTRGVHRATVEEYLAYCGVNRANLSSESWTILAEIFDLSLQNDTAKSTERDPAMVDASGFPSKIVHLTNQQRANEGLSALAEDTQLMEMAALRSQELAWQMNYTQPNGQGATSWVLNETGARSAGENIASGYASPQHVVGGWMDSSGHRVNILKERYTRMGAGCYQDPDTLVTYWVQLFTS